MERDAAAIPAPRVLRTLLPSLVVASMGCGWSGPPVPSHIDREVQDVPSLAHSAWTLAAAPKARRCGAFAQDAEIVPTRADWIGSARIDLLLKSRPVAAVQQRFAQASGTPILSDVLRGCGVKQAGLRVTFGGSFDGGGVVLLRGRNAGKAATFPCIAKSLDPHAKPPANRTGACGPELDLPGGAGKVFLIGRDVAVFASSGWADAVLERLQGKGAAASQGALSWVRRSVQVNRPMWAGGNVTPAIAGTLAAGAAGLTRVSMSLGLAPGLEFDVHTAFSSPAQSQAAQVQLDQLIAQATMMAPLLGFPTLAGKTKVARSGHELGFSLSLTAADVAVLEATMLAEFDRRGPGGSPPLPDRTP